MNDILIKDDKFYKKHNIIMLPHNNINTKFTLYKNNKLSKNLDILDYHTNQHLYITSNEDILKENWFIANQSPFKCLEVVEGNYPFKIANQHNNKEIQYQSKHWKGNKIIASTDILNCDLLYGQGIYNIPYIPDYFIAYYIENYNNKNFIKEVLIEMIHTLQGLEDDDSEYADKYFIKVNKDNTINILIN